MTNRDIDVYNFIVKFIKKYQYSPSIREIGKALGLSSSSSVHRHLVILKRLKYIKYEKGKSRTIVILERSCI